MPFQLKNKQTNKLTAIDWLCPTTLPAATKSICKTWSPWWWYVEAEPWEGDEVRRVHVWDLVPMVMICGGGALGRGWGHESGALMNGISAFIAEAWESSFTTSSRCRRHPLHLRRWLYTWRWSSQDTNPASTFISDVQPLELWEITAVVYKPPSQWHFCCNSLNRLVKVKSLSRVWLFATHGL